MKREKRKRETVYKEKIQGNEKVKDLKRNARGRSYQYKTAKRMSKFYQKQNESKNEICREE